jgi:hypothetical protein
MKMLGFDVTFYDEMPEDTIVVLQERIDTHIEGDKRIVTLTSEVVAVIKNFSV